MKATSPKNSKNAKRQYKDEFFTASEINEIYESLQPQVKFDEFNSRTALSRVSLIDVLPDMERFNEEDIILDKETIMSELMENGLLSLANERFDLVDEITEEDIAEWKAEIAAEKKLMFDALEELDKEISPEEDDFAADWDIEDMPQNLVSDEELFFEKLDQIERSVADEIGDDWDDAIDMRLERDQIARWEATKW